MNTIVCAIRGGEASRLTQERAIQLAKADNSRLIYLYVVHLDNLGHLGPGEVLAAQTELAWLGKVLLQIAQRRASQAGVKAETFMGYGPVREAIERFLQQEKVDLLLIGAPRQETRRPVFPNGDLAPFVRSLEARTGVKIEVVQDK